MSAPIRAFSRVVTQSNLRSFPGLQDETSSTPQGQESTKPRIREAELQTFYLQRENGELAPFFRMPFEEFEEIYRLYRGIDEGELPPRYSISQIAIDGVTDKRLAYLDVEIQIRANAEGWIEVPLRLDNCTLRSRESSVGENVAFLSVGRNGEGLACWLNGKDGDETTLKLKVVCPIVAFGSQYGLKVDLPVSASSKLNLRVPFVNAIVEVNDEGTLQEVTHPVDSETQFILFGRPGGFDVSWRERDAMGMGTVDLAVESQATLFFDDTQQVRWQFAIDVTGIGGAVEAFKATLPSGIQVMPSDSDDYAIEVLDEDENQRREVLITFSIPQERAPTVILNGLQDWVESTDGGFRRIQGLEVKDAIRHRGRWDVFVSGRELMVDWAEPLGMVHSPRDVTLPDTPFLRSLGDARTTAAAAVSMAGFEFNRQPCEVSLRVERQPTSISADPVITLTATRDQVQLDARYRVSLSGSLTSRLIVDLGDWNQDVIIFGDVVERFAAEPADPQRYVIELDLAKLAKQPEFEIGIEAVTLLEPGSREFNLSFPMPVGARLKQTTLLIEQEESLVIRPKREAMQPVPDSTIPAWHSSNVASSAVSVYRGLVNEQRSQIAFDLSLRPRTIAYRSNVQVELNESAINVVTRFDLEVKHQPLRSIGIEIPESAFVDSDVLVSFRDQNWSFAKEDLVVTSDGMLDAILDFEQPLLGEESIEIKFSVSPSRVIPQAIEDTAISDPDSTELADESLNHEFEIALARPFVQKSPITRSPIIFPDVTVNTDTEGSGKEPLQYRLLQLELDHPIEYELNPTSTVWDRLDVIDESGRMRSSYVTSQAIEDPEIKLLIRNDRKRIGLQPGIDRVWVQTQVVGTDRQDRAAFAIRTRQPELVFRLPRGATLGQVAINNQPVENPFQETKDGLTFVTLSLEGLTEEVQHLEFWYRFSMPGSDYQSIEFDWPRLQGVAWVDRMYWQLVVPSDQYLAWTNGTHSAEHQWSFGTLLLDLQSRLSQRELENWIGVQKQADATRGANVYLFSSFGEVSTASAQTIPRLWVLILGSVSAFVFGVATIYVRRLRSPLLMLGVLVVVVPLAWVHAQLALLVLQVALLGVLCAFVALIFRFAFAPPKRVSISDSSSHAETASTSLRQSGGSQQRGSSLGTVSVPQPGAEASSV